MSRQPRATVTRRANAGAASIVDIPPTGVSRPNPTEEEVRRLAHQIYLERVARGEPGTPQGDWFEAERRLRGR
jgi:hypothetical protein